ncbi:LuxR C-terminal-related transcriptional regulator [Halomonas sp. BM-2019]|uniref:LuxR C-terminal-related transcriptional regulator n=1 Tax=Halomonas sp. BM-2019 TaxID=2811227 RepID=UPI001B3C35BA|nr:MAG: DNA-binding response regulator [Halomonas sp. BM-2019]
MNIRNRGAFVTEHNPQTLLFIDYIKNNADCIVSLISPSNQEAKIDDDVSLVLIDVNHVNERGMQKWQELLSSNDKVYVAALNLNDEQHAAELLSYMDFSGVFYRTDSLEMICKGIGRLLEGHLWMSRSLMTRLIKLFRKQSLNSYRPACGLTQREVEIIGLLGSGASNIQIADRLFVSEHTVKSHLYNIFKKISVNNRTQAVNWARQNLGAPPPLFQLQRRRGEKACSNDFT